MYLGSIILFVKDMKTVIAFYRDGIGLAPDKEQPFPEHRFFCFNTGLANCAFIARANRTRGDKN